MWKERVFFFSFSFFDFHFAQHPEAQPIMNTMHEALSRYDKEIEGSFCILRRSISYLSSFPSDRSERASWFI